MDGRVGRLTCRYRVISDSGSGSTPARLDGVVREHLTEACERSLQQIMGSGPAVYVVRRIQVSLALNARADWQDTAVARAWGARVAQAAVTEIARSADSSNVVQFEDQADYVASFLADLLPGTTPPGTAWTSWFYGCFVPFRRGTISDSVMAVLEENQEHVPAILVRLKRRGVLERLMNVLDASAIKRIWEYGLELSRPSSAEDLRPLFAAALRLAGGGENRRGLAERQFQEYLAAAPSPPDWRDPGSLALAVVAAVEFLRKRGYLSAEIAELASDWRTRGKQALAEFDWLDAGVLQDALDRWISARENTASSPADRGAEPPLRPAGSTPRRRQLIKDLAKAMAAGLPALSEALESPASALRFYALLGDYDLNWTGGPLAARAIEGLLATAAWIVAQPKSHAGSASAWIHRGLTALAATKSPEAELAAQFLDANSASAWKQAILRLAALAAARREADSEGNFSRLLLLLDAGGPDRERILRSLQEIAKSGERNASDRSVWIEAALASLAKQDPAATLPRRFLQAYGDAGLDLALTIAAGERGSQQARPRAGAESSCAGVWLLLRAIRDARLPSIARQAGYPLTPCLLALGLRWGGEQALFRGRIDPGLCALAGHEGEMTLDQLRAIWRGIDPASHARFQAGMLKSLLAHRIMVEPGELYRLNLRAGSHALACGAAVPGAWMPGCIVDGADPDGEAVAIAELAQTWQGATSREFTAAPASPSSQAEFHQAFESLSHGALGLADADLTLGLTAIAVLRVWAKWLRQLSSSSAPYLLNSFIRRPGRVLKDRDILVEIAPQALDIVLEMSGYLGRLHAPEEPWQCNVDLRIRGF